MATQTLTTADAILKDLYVGPIVEQLNQKTYILDKVERDSEQIDHTGRRAVVPVHSSRNRGRGSISDGGTAPTAGKQSWQDAIINIRYHLYGIELTDAAIEGSKRNEGAFVSLMAAETKGVAVDMRKDINRQVFGQADTTGSSGLLGNCGVTSASTTVTMASKYDMQYIQIGDNIDIRTQSTGALITNGNQTVLTRNVSAGTFTVAVAVTTSTNEGVYLAGNRANEMDGLRFIVSTGRTLHSINSSTAGNEFWNSSSRDVGTSLAALATAGESSFEQLYDDVGVQGQGDLDVWLTTRGVKRRLADTYQSQKRMNDARMVEVHGGYTAIMVNETPVIADDDAPKTFAFGLTLDTLKWYEQVAPGWLESKDGSIFQLKTNVQGRYDTAWQAWFKWYAALGCHRPNGNGRLRFCNDDDPS